MPCYSEVSISERATAERSGGLVGDQDVAEAGADGAGDDRTLCRPPARRGRRRDVNAEA